MKVIRKYTSKKTGEVKIYNYEYSYSRKESKENTEEIKPERVANPYCTDLTRKTLEKMGITNVYWDEEKGEWWINRFWHKNNSKTIFENKRVNVRTSRCKHKYVEDTYYPIIAISYNGKVYTWSLSRFLWAWFHKRVPVGYVIDHIDNNRFNNRLDNLQLLTIEENNHKRFEDNPDLPYFNQFSHK